MTSFKHSNTRTRASAPAAPKCGRNGLAFKELHQAFHSDAVCFSMSAVPFVVCALRLSLLLRCCFHLLVFFVAKTTAMVDIEQPQIVRSNKEVQFHLGYDDTALENLMRRLRSNRRPTERHQAKDEEGGQAQQRTVADGGEDVPANGPGSATTTFKGIYSGNGTVAGTDTGEQDYPAPRYGTYFDGSGGRTSSAAGSAPLPPPLRLGKFLRQASVVMETLCEENLLHAPGKRWGESHPLDPTRGGDEDAIGRERGALFSGEGGREGDGWEEVGAEGGVFSVGAHGATAAATADTGSPTAEEKRRQRDDEDWVRGRGAEALLQGSEVVGVEFSAVKRSMLVTAHARPVGRRRRSEDSGGGGGDRGVDEREAVLEGCGVVCVWNTDNVQVRVGRQAIQRINLTNWRHSPFQPAMILRNFQRTPKSFKAGEETSNYCRSGSLYHSRPEALWCV